MSQVEQVALRCPACGHEAERPVVVSLNAARNPEQVARVVDGSFQRFRCAGCSEASRVDRRMLYVDWEAGLWIDVHAASGERAWTEREAETRRCWRATLIDLASPDARALAAGLRPRAVFGFAALREKVVAQQAGLSDVWLEVLKLDLVRRSGTLSPVRPRLERVDETLHLRGPGGVLQVDRSHYDRIVHDPLAWSTALSTLEEGPWVDLGRVLVA